MVLRRLMQHVREQNWFAVGIDFVVVVFGIFLGMQVNSWNNNRHLNGLEAQYLESIKLDVEASQQYLSERLVRIREQADGLEQILLLSADGFGDKSDLEISQHIHNGLNSAAVLPVQMLAYEELKGSNTVEIIKNFEIRNKLRALDALILLIRQQETERMHVLYSHVDPMLTNYPAYIELIRHWRNFYREGDPITRLLGKHSAKDFFEDPKLVNVSILMMGVNRTEIKFLEDLEPFYVELNELIDQELNKKKR